MHIMHKKMSVCIATVCTCLICTHGHIYGLLLHAQIHISYAGFSDPTPLLHPILFQGSAFARKPKLKKRGKSAGGKKAKGGKCLSEIQRIEADRVARRDRARQVSPSSLLQNGKHCFSWPVSGCDYASESLRLSLSLHHVATSHHLNPI